MQKQEFSLPGLLLDLKECRNRKDLQRGRLLHSEARHLGWHQDKFVATALISMYTKCKSMHEALLVFDSMAEQDTVSWTTLIRGYVENGESLKALEAFERMNCTPDGVTFVAALKACSALASGNRLDKRTCLQKGSSIHHKVRESRFQDDIFVANTLIDMYSKCGEMGRAEEVFDRLLHRDVVSWSALIRGYVENGECLAALDVFERMDCRPEGVTLAAVLKACSCLAASRKLDRQSCLRRGKMIHRLATQYGLDRDLYVGNTLVDMYSKCGEMYLAEDISRRIEAPDIITWNALILGYVDNGESLKALYCFDGLPRSCAPDRITFVAASKACGSLASEGRLERKLCLQRGHRLLQLVRDQRFDKEISVANTLVDMFSKCGDMTQARDVFNRMTHRSVVSWSALILGYVENGQSLLALEMFDCMDCPPDKVTFLAVLKACGTLAGEKRVCRKACLEKGLGIHELVRESELEVDGFITSALLDMYCKCGDMTRAKEFFDREIHRDVVSWNVLILGYVENNESSTALEIFSRMSCSPDRATFVAVLKACAALAAEKKPGKQSCLEKGGEIHRLARDRGLDKEVPVMNTLIDMYSKCGRIDLARDVFNDMRYRDVVTWSTLIHGYAENGESSIALELFNCMDCTPNSYTFTSALKACAHLGAQETGQRIHLQLQELGLDTEEKVASCLVDLYAKCGNMAAAEEVFNRMDSRDIVTWSALIGGYSFLGKFSEVFKLVKRMEEAGVRMDGVTMLLILTACSHAGRVAEGRKYFNSMGKYGVTRTVEHCTCMVEMLGRDNKVEEALSLVREMESEADSQVWMTLLEACKRCCNLEVAKVAFSQLVAMEDEKHLAGACVLMRNIYERLGVHFKK